MKIMTSTSDSSTDEEDSQELQRLKDAAVTLEPRGGDLHANQNVPANIIAMNEVANNTKAAQSQISSKPSLRPKQSYSEDSSDLKTTPGFRTHVAKKLSDILDKELQFSESAVEKCSEKQKSSKSGIRLLSSSKKFLKVDPNTVPDPKLSSNDNKPVSSTDRKRANPKSNKQTDSSSDSLNAKRQKYDEESLKIAIECVKSKSLTLGKTAKHFDIPKSTLQDKVKGKYAFRKEKTILNQKEENKLAEWLNVAARRGCGCTKQQLLHQVQKILNLQGRVTIFNDNLPGNRWYYAFLRRQGNLSLHQTQRLGSGQAALTEEMIRQWFKDTRKQLKKEGSDLSFFEDPHRIFSCDELGFPLCPKTGKVLTCKTDKQVNRATDNIKTQITILTCASAAGNIMKPMLIFPGIKFHYDPLAGFKEAVFAKSPKGWVESDVFESWLAEIFIPFVRLLKKPVVLFLDGHITRVSLRAHELCIENQIFYYSLPHRASHIVQPLDLNLFKSFKVEWRKASVEFRDEHAITKINFAGVLKKVWSRTVTTQKIIAGFQASGIYPWNPEAVNYQKLSTNKLSVQSPVEGLLCSQTQSKISDHQNNLDMLLDVIQLITRKRLMDYRKILREDGSCRESEFIQFSSFYRKVAGIPQEMNVSFDNLPLPEMCLEIPPDMKMEEQIEKKPKKKEEKQSNRKSTRLKNENIRENSSESEEEISLNDDIVATVNNLLMFENTENTCCVCRDDSDKSGWIGCDKCERWYHKECAKTDEDLTLMDEAELESFPFICEYCS